MWTGMRGSLVPGNSLLTWPWNFRQCCREGRGRHVEVHNVTPKEVLALIREKEVRAVDLRFMDFPGLWQHFTIPADALSENTFEEGLGFDGSSIRGWQAIQHSHTTV